ncbi:MAG: ATP-binding cassette domain-containing protein [Hyphomicrobiaceae bacterium]|nr:ATP-binding cassette domain-containing protein [Hyphomicrobiaceae bacterium]MCC0011483.1 ATP-binding cassette domain-containing protein [Hyphomicrobiaceae bacterium]
MAKPSRDKALKSRSKRAAPTEDKSNGDDVAENSRRSLRPLLAFKPYIMKHPLMVAAAFVALVVSAGAMLLVPMAVRRMIDYGFGSDDGLLINQYFGMLIVIGSILAIASASRFYFVNWLGERVVADVRSDVFGHMTELGPTFFERTHSGEVMSRLTADTTQIKAAAGTALSQALRNSIMLIGALIMMFVTSPQLSTMVLLAIPAIVLPLMAYGRVVRRLSRQAQDSLAEASAYASENLVAVRTMQAFANEKNVSNRFGSAVEDAFESARRRLKARAGLTAMAIFLVVASVTGVLWFGASSVVSGEMTGGRLGQFVLYALFAAGAMAELSEVWGEISQAAGAAERLSELLGEVPEIRSPENPHPLPEPAKGEIALDNVTFAYPSRPDAAALSDFSLQVKPGETVALVGPSGAGKSTLFTLLLRFFDPSSGRVLVDGVDVRDADLAALRARIALVPQDVALFADTIAANISYGAKTASRAEIEAAAVAAQADGFIRNLPDGYDTRLGERGVTLSGGQRQRLAIARAVLKDAPILLLDEATSALDAENEVLVQRALERVMENRTTIVIAHRLATVQKADRIVVMDDGRIVEEGRHADLARGSGLYSRLAELQFGGEAAE